MREKQAQVQTYISGYREELTNFRRKCSADNTYTPIATRGHQASHALQNLRFKSSDRNTI